VKSCGGWISEFVLKIAPSFVPRSFEMQDQKDLSSWQKNNDEEVWSGFEFVQQYRTGRAWNYIWYVEGAALIGVEMIQGAGKE
jgi:hypothetical protein